MRAVIGVVLVTLSAAARAQPVLQPNELAPEPVERPAVAAAVAAEPAAGHWLTLGVVSTGGRLGARAELDLVAIGHVSLGIALAGYDRNGVADATVGSAGTAGAYLAVTTHWRGWHLRAQLGAGASLEVRAMTRTDLVPLGVAPIVEAGLYVSRDLIGGWGVTAGPIVTHSTSSDPMSTTPASAVSLFGGLTRRF